MDETLDGPYLINKTGTVVENSQHGHQSIGSASCSCNVASTGPYVVNVDANASAVLANEGAVTERLVDALNTVLHVQEKTG